MKASRGKADPALVNELVKQQTLSSLKPLHFDGPCRRTNARSLDFAGVRDRVVAATHTERGRDALALELAPQTDFDAVRREQARTEAVRSLIVGCRSVHVMRGVETAALTEAAEVGRTLARQRSALGRRMRSARGGRGASCRTRARRSSRRRRARYTPLRELSSLHRRRHRRTRQRARSRVAGARAHPAQSRASTSRGARPSRRDPRSAKYAKAIQDRIVTIRDGRFVVPIKAEFAGEFPGIVHDTSSSGQTLFVEPLAALETNNRVRTLQIEEEREVARILEALSRDVGAHAAADRAQTSRCSRGSICSPPRPSSRARTRQRRARAER